MRCKVQILLMLIFFNIITILFFGKIQWVARLGTFSSCKVLWIKHKTFCLWPRMKDWRTLYFNDKRESESVRERVCVIERESVFVREKEKERVSV